jgi:hypothetical protein
MLFWNLLSTADIVTFIVLFCFCIPSFYIISSFPACVNPHHQPTNTQLTQQLQTPLYTVFHSFKNHSHQTLHSPIQKLPCVSPPPSSLSASPPPPSPPFRTSSSAPSPPPQAASTTLSGSPTAPLAPLALISALFLLLSATTAPLRCWDTRVSRSRGARLPRLIPGVRHPA